VRSPQTLERCLDQMRFPIAALMLILAVPAFAQTATDGDTIKLNGTTWRLWGIDAPEARQTCADAWASGRQATAALRGLIEGQAVACELRGHDRYGRSIGLCRAAGKDLGAELNTPST
jgi:endonuclease YncB( thermonuclease family)